MKTRIEELLAHFEMSASRFADELGIQRSGMSHILSGRNKPSLELMQKVLARFPEVSTDWLISGKGDMLNTPKQPVVPVFIPLPEEKPTEIQITQVQEEPPYKGPVKEDEIIEKVAEEAPVKEVIKPVKPVTIIPKPIEKPVLQVFSESQPEKMILPREQLALFEVPAIDQPATGPNDPPAIYNITTPQTKYKDTMPNTEKPTERPASNAYPLPDNSNKQAVAQMEMAKAIIASPQGKTIERIVVFYSDKTFSAYSPE